MQRGEVIRETLLDNTIHVIATGGFENATTRNIAKYHSPISQSVKLNDAYIYRIFGSKEGLYAEAFLLLDAELTAAFTRSLARVDLNAQKSKEILYLLWQDIWGFVLQNEDHCRCYVRYYYSIYYKEGAQRKHRETFDRVVSALRPLFKQEADVTAIMHSVLTTILDFAIRVYNGDLENTPGNAQQIFNVLYCSVSTYLLEQD